MDTMTDDTPTNGFIFREGSGDTFFLENDNGDFFSEEKTDPLVIDGIHIRPYSKGEKRTRDDPIDESEPHPLYLFDEPELSVDTNGPKPWIFPKPLSPSPESSPPLKRHKTESIAPVPVSTRRQIESASLHRMQSDSFLSRQARSIGKQRLRSDAKWTRKHTWTAIRHIVDTYRNNSTSPCGLDDTNHVRPLVLRVIESWCVHNRLDIRKLKMDCIKRDIRVALNALFVAGIFTSSRESSNKWSEERFAMHFLVRSLASTSTKDECVSTDLIKVAFIYVKTLFHFANNSAVEQERDGKTPGTTSLQPGRLSQLINHIMAVYKVLGLVEDRVIHLKKNPGAKLKEPIESVSISPLMRESYAYSKHKLEIPALGNGPSDISIKGIMRFIRETGQSTVSS